MIRRGNWESMTRPMEEGQGVRSMKRRERGVVRGRRGRMARRTVMEKVTGIPMKTRRILVDRIIEKDMFKLSAREIGFVIL